MAVFKCKMCGGNLEVVEGQNVGTCDSCGSTMTLPKGNDERLLNLFNRATHYRQQNEFDKAIATYESILEEDSENAEAYWGLVLSKYGIEYVEDPKTHKRIPTCHRLQHESILSDLDYKSALKYALDHEAERLYTEEANRIAEIQKNILSVANKEEAYDIFICYKETDNSGKRTMDSVLAQDIYYQLTNEGYKVFFSRITLEDKLGTEYEPYIFAALNSAKIMLVVGTDRDNFNAVWVKNEWSRFLALSKKNKDKLIIPCYRDMDVYDLPEELSMFQSQDMNKIGFMQDLLRGINKVLSVKSENEKETIVQQVHDYEKEADLMLKRAFMLLEDADWNKANILLEKVLDIDPENARAYLGKLMVDVKVNKEENLAKRAVKLSDNPNYQKTIRFADNDLKQKIERYNLSASEIFETYQAEKAEQEQRLKVEREKKEQEQRTESEKKKYLTELSQSVFPSLFRYKVIAFLTLLVCGIIAMFIPMGTFMVAEYKTLGEFLVIGAVVAWIGAVVCCLFGIKHNFSYSDQGSLEQQKAELKNNVSQCISNAKKKIIITGTAVICFVVIIPLIWMLTIRGSNTKKYNELVRNLRSIDYVTDCVKNRVIMSEFDVLIPDSHDSWLSGNEGSEWRSDDDFEYIYGDYYDTYSYWTNGDNENYSMTLDFSDSTGRFILEMVTTDPAILLGTEKTSNQNVSLDALSEKYDIKHTNYRTGYSNYSGYYCTYNGCKIWFNDEMENIEITIER